MNNLNYLKDSIFKCFLKSIIGFYFFLKKNLCPTYNDGKFKF